MALRAPGHQASEDESPSGPNRKQIMKPILPYEIRNKVMDYFDQGYSTDEIVDKIRKEAEPYLKPNQDLKGCVAAIKAQRSQGKRPRPYSVIG